MTQNHDVNTDEEVASTFDRKPQPTDHEVFPDTVTDSSGDVFTDLDVDRPEDRATTAGDFNRAIGYGEVRSGPMQATVDPFFEARMEGFEQGHKEARAMVDYEAANRRMNALHVAVDFLRTREKDPAKVVEAAATFAAFLEGPKRD